MESIRIPENILSPSLLVGRILLPTRKASSFQSVVLSVLVWIFDVRILSAAALSVISFLKDSFKKLEISSGVA